MVLSCVQRQEKNIISLDSWSFHILVLIININKTTTMKITVAYIPISIVKDEEVKKSYEEFNKPLQIQSTLILVYLQCKDENRCRWRKYGGKYRLVVRHERG